MRYIKSCYRCKNLKDNYCEIIEHHVSNGYAAQVHAKECKDHLKFKEVGLKGKRKKMTREEKLLKQKAYMGYRSDLLW